MLACNTCMWYTYKMDENLQALDEAIVAFRVATQRPAYHQRILAGRRFDGGVASLRVLRSVERQFIEGAGPSIRQVATDLGLEHSTASRSVDVLVRGGLLEKSLCEKDQRQVRLQLTKEGAEILAEATARRQEAVASVIRDWSESDLATVTRLLGHLTRGFDAEFGQR